MSDGTFHAVTNITGPSGGNYAVTARQQNNMIISTTDSPNPSSWQRVTSNASAPSGVVFIVHTGGSMATAPLPAGGIAIPQQVYFCDFTSGSRAGANCGGEPGGPPLSNTPLSIAGSMDTFIKNGDHVWPYGSHNDAAQRWPYALGVPSVTALSGVTNGSPGSLTLSIAATLTGRFPVLPLPVR